ncbi:hypothetical protein DYB26_013365 [Aphanomyces astaci]|uniref:Uncharacterized protein n=1 Tax=Aphanomyces astaci TaxID=112090 RepID=A0A418FUJ2_APHAT|nr:hypothetical protein DYB26_013365 [Aphanomyces astaci]
MQAVRRHQARLEPDGGDHLCAFDHRRHRRVLPGVVLEPRAAGGLGLATSARTCGGGRGHGRLGGAGIAFPNGTIVERGRAAHVCDIVQESRAKAERDHPSIGDLGVGRVARVWVLHHVQGPKAVGRGRRPGIVGADCAHPRQGVPSRIPQEPRGGRAKAHQGRCPACGVGPVAKIDQAGGGGRSYSHHE